MVSEKQLQPPSSHHAPNYSPQVLMIIYHKGSSVEKPVAGAGVSPSPTFPSSGLSGLSPPPLSRHQGRNLRMPQVCRARSCQSRPDAQHIRSCETLGVGRRVPGPVGDAIESARGWLATRGLTPPPVTPRALPAVPRNPRIAPVSFRHIYQRTNHSLPSC